jgi:hypothetical protein
MHYIDKSLINKNKAEEGGRGGVVALQKTWVDGE